MRNIPSFLVRFHKVILFLWLAAAIIMGVFATKLPSMLEGDGFRTDGEYEQVQKDLTDTFDFPESTIMVLFEKEKKESKAAFEDKIGYTLTEIKKLGLASAIESPLDNTSLMKKDTAYAMIHIDDKTAEMPAIISDIKSR
ncbi:hypothetical protein MKZ02_06115 [Pseudobacillus sp. FSL P4-0506]|uniref:hypothetical protein n=1 Tax=Pseudobacillus sp. FSL P4-0506 TaxID=2921576 RepID=UPI0030F8DB94